MADAYILKSKIKELVKSHGLRVSADAINAINNHVVEAMKKAVKRAKDNNRKTIIPQDI